MAEQIKVYEINDFEGNEAHGSFYINTLAEHFRKHPFVTKPHRHDFYIIVHFTGGVGTHIIDFVNYKVSYGSVFFLLPGQVHNWSLSSDTDGRILFFKRDFIEDYFIKKITSYSVFHSKYQLYQIDDASVEKQISLQMETMEQEYFAQPQDMGLIRNYLDILLIRLGRLFPISDAHKADSGTWNMQKLEALIEQYYTQHQPPGFYADHLNFSVKYLNDLCKKHLNKTTSQLIHDRIILEAKRLLTHDGLSIKEIAAQLNFEDHAYFTRLFKKMTGKAPGAFREEVKRE